MEAYREGQGGDGEALAMHLADRQRTGVEQIETAMELVAADLRATEIVEKQGLKQVSDTGALEKIIDDLIAANPGQASAVKEKPQAIGWFVGQVMKATQGKANPGAVNELLKAKLGL